MKDHLRQRVRIQDVLNKRYSFGLRVDELKGANLNKVERLISKMPTKNVNIFRSKDPEAEGFDGTRATTPLIILFCFSGERPTRLPSSFPGGCSQGRLFKIAEKWTTLPNSDTLASRSQFSAEGKEDAKCEGVDDNFWSLEEEATRLWGQSCLCVHNDYKRAPVECTDEK